MADAYRRDEVRLLRSLREDEQVVEVDVRAVLKVEPLVELLPGLVSSP